CRRRRRVRERRRPGHAHLQRHQQRSRAEDLDRRPHRVRAGDRRRSESRPARELAATARPLGSAKVMLLVEAWQFIVAHPDRFFGALLTHVTLSAAALALATAIALPTGVWLAGTRRAASIAIATANVGRTLPSLAVLALVMPLLGTGFLPSLFALTLLALPPILLNSYTGIRQVEPEIVDAARGMGMTRGEIVRKVELPIATPVIFAGIRTAAVQVVSGAVLAAYIGGGGLGDFITAGIALMALPQLLVGAIPATLLALGADQLFGRLQRALTPKGLRSA